MMHSICKDAKLDFKGRCITNHSMRSTGIHNLVELGVTLDEQMIFSQHKTIAGVSAYQHQSLKSKRNNVSLLIPLEEAEPNSHEPDSCEPDSHKPDSCIALKDSTSNYINKGFSKASDLLSSKFNGKKTEVDAKAKVNNESEADAKAKVDNEPEAKASNKFKANDDESKAQSDDEANSGVKYKKAKIPNIAIENCSNISINISLMP
ncbi:hypothetical protein C2G38_1343593 [Gigaspora rosea]|uniref:Uncharacterized protein n=1 Tax=Gigaspora rosea TaxID=44941 RepID=A0A397VGR7_9GLOM|nr:hypothetical protein C2G38_1343593 [Gigaspora rosea]